MKLGLIGQHIGHSLSQKLHTNALAYCGITGEFNVFDLAAGQVAETLNNCFQSGYAGLNVTAPYKEIVTEYCESLQPPVDIFGSTNTLVRGKNGWIAQSTDHKGVWFAMDRIGLIETGSALLLGAGGSARAACYALLERKWQVSVAARRIEQALQLAEDAISIGEVNVVPWEYREQYIDQAHFIVQCTTIGNDGISSPLPLDRNYPSSLSYLDVLYSPRETPLAALLKRHGIRTMNGLPWLFGQGAAAFQLWTNRTMPDSLFDELEK